MPVFRPKRRKEKNIPFGAAHNCMLQPSVLLWLSNVTFNNDEKPPPTWILREFDVSRIRPRAGGLPHLETFTWKNLTQAKRVTRSGRPGNPPRRVTPPIM